MHNLTLFKEDVEVILSHLQKRIIYLAPPPGEDIPDIMRRDRRECQAVMDKLSERIRQGLHPSKKEQHG